MKNTFFLLVSITSILSFGCAGKDFYLSSQIDVRSIKKGKNVNVIEYIVPLETLYFSPGCIARYNTDSTVVELEFIRQKINTVANINLKSKLVNETNKISYFIELPITIKKAIILHPNKVLML